MPTTVSDKLKPYQLKEAITAIPGMATEMTAAYADYKAAVIVERPFPCPKCLGQGLHAESVDTGDPGDTDLIECTLETADNKCDGYGYTTTQVIAVVPAVTYEDV